jgi:hypothetical protein
MQDGFLRKKPFPGITFPLHQLENRYSIFTALDCTMTSRLQQEIQQSRPFASIEAEALLEEVRCAIGNAIPIA